MRTWQRHRHGHRSNAISEMGPTGPGRVVESCLGNRRSRISAHPRMITSPGKASTLDMAAGDPEVLMIGGYTGRARLLRICTCIGFRKLRTRAKRRPWSRIPFRRTSPEIGGSNFVLRVGCGKVPAPTRLTDGVNRRHRRLLCQTLSAKLPTPLIRSEIAPRGSYCVTHSTSSLTARIDAKPGGAGFRLPRDFSPAIPVPD